MVWLNKYYVARTPHGKHNCLSSASRGTFRFHIRAGRHYLPVRGARPFATSLHRMFLPSSVNGSIIFFNPKLVFAAKSSLDYNNENRIMHKDGQYVSF